MWAGQYDQFGREIWRLLSAFVVVVGIGWHPYIHHNKVYLS